MLRRVAALAATFAMGAGAVVAEADDNKGLNLFVGPGLFIFNDDNLENTEALNLGVGYKFAKRWGVEAIYSDLASTEFSDGVAAVADINAKAYMGSLLYYLNGSDTFKPYVAVGAGRTDFDATGALADDEQSTYNAGLGFRQFFTDRLSFRGDARLTHYADASENGATLMLGLDYMLGQAASSAAAPKPAGPQDSDGDGVYDAVDQCPDTPAGIAVNASGCPLDSDGDGVYDYKDQCPDTPAGARVDEKGCQYVITESVSVELEVLFDTDKSVVKPAFVAEIKRVADFMTLFPATKAVIEGHSDASGAADYNQKLSQRRAEAVRNVLINEHGIAADRLSAKGYGESRPRADNETTEGRKQNRRVVAVIETEVEKKAE